ncbi:MAG: hypothetical protein ACXWC4_04060 [Telluria sp.]
MQHTLIAVFDNRADADRAQNDLLMAGFKRDCVKLSNSDPTGITDSVSGTGSSASEASTHHEGLGASIKHFFADIFGTDNSEHAQRYEDAVSRGHHVLTVTTDSEPEVERAADVVERHGPVDIDEKHAEWTAGGTHPEAMRASGAGGLQQSSMRSQQSAGQGLQQADLRGEDSDRNLFAQQSLNDDVPMGQTYQEPQGSSGWSLQGSSLEGSAQQSPGTTGSMRSSAGDIASGTSLQRDSALSGTQQRDTGLSGTAQRAGVRVFSRADETPASSAYSAGSSSLMGDDDYYRRDWTSKYSTSGGRYEDFQPAYSYGAEMARNEQYRGRQWNDVESDLRDTWERRHPGASSTWERFKAAIRHGWDRMSGDEASRSHWNSNYASAGGSYDDYAPAYSYGSEMAGDARYRGRKWDDVESDLRSDWDTRHPGDSGASTWERFKAAVRHGWERMTGTV